MSTKQTEKKQQHKLSSQQEFISVCLEASDDKSPKQDIPQPEEQVITSYRDFDHWLLDK